MSKSLRPGENMQLVHAVAFLLFAGAAHAASPQQQPSFSIPKGASVDCVPSPSKDQIDAAIWLQAAGKTSGLGAIRCAVPAGQSVPEASVFVGDIREIEKDLWGIAFQGMTIPGGFMWFPDMTDEILSVAQSKVRGALRITFKRSQTIGGSEQSNDEISKAQYEAGQREILIGARPLGTSMTVTDSQGCAWEVIEDKGMVKVIRYLTHDQSPVCAKKPEGS